MNRLTFLIAGRYLVGSRAEKNISIMLLICFIGIFIGAFALALIASIMNGFEKMTHEKLQGIHAQIIMRSNGNELDDSKIETILRNEFPEIAAFSPSTFKQVIIQKPNSEEITNAVLLKAINPADEEQTSIIGTKIIQAINTTKTLSSLVHDNHILIGNKLAQLLEIKPGDTVDLLFVTSQNIRGRTISLNSKEAIIGGIFATGIEEFDSNLILASFDFTHHLFPDAGVSQFNIKLKPDVNENNTIEKLRQRFNLDAFSWKELYPPLIAALKLEKYAMFFILALIALVACMNIISLIFMKIIQKRPDIAIYQAMGMSRHDITTLFMLMGTGVAAIAGLCGLVMAAIVGLLLQRYPFISLPDTYYVSHLPIQMEWYIFVIVFTLIVGMSFIATWIPCRNIRSIEAANILRFEG